MSSWCRVCEARWIDRVAGGCGLHARNASPETLPSPETTITICCFETLSLGVAEECSACACFCASNAARDARSSAKMASPWVVVTGGGSGIGRALVHHFCGSHRVLACGRRSMALRDTLRSAPHPEAVVVVR